ncbi:MAG TPA: sigma-70 family RNA polymerase sigma factor, partial [Conexibacter sp.]|nr:sigma-70 family RNA polymerase sigma factor [Conexibacter sp.]
MEHASVVVAPGGVRRSARLLRLAGDERLVALVRAGEDAAFEALYDRHHGPILGFCRHMLGSREEAEDALQHTFLAAYADLVASEKPIDLRPWLFAIARNRCLSLLRARREHVALELAEPATDGLAAAVERREDLRELLADLARLPEDQRAALLLAELGALDHAGIATVLGCPREKVKALVFQARSSLTASREARAMPCEQIRMELATASGGELRRGPLRRHLRACEGCRAFKAEIAGQRKLLALALPVVPSVALKAGVLSGVGCGAHGGAAGAAGAAAATGATTGASGGTLGGALATVASSGAAKLAVSVAVASAIAGGGVLAVRSEHGARAAHAAAAARRLRSPDGPTSPAAGGSVRSGALPESAVAQGRGGLATSRTSPGGSRSHAPASPGSGTPGASGRGHPPGATRRFGAATGPSRAHAPAARPPRGTGRSGGGTPSTGGGSGRAHGG